MIWVWGIVTAVALILEFVSTGLISIWFAAGGLVTLMVVAIWPNLALIWQLIIFVAVSCILLLSTRKIFTKITKNTPELKTNTDAIIGKKFKIQTVKENGQMYHKLSDVEWRVVEDSGEELKLGDEVEIVNIKGNKLVVNKTKNKKGDK